MKALFYSELKGPTGITRGDLPVPDINENEALVRIKAFSLNHLDIWVMSGTYPGTVSLPHVFGSDASGIVEETGSNVHHVKAGDEVVIFPGLSCGHCEPCLNGRDNECNGFSVLGVATPGVSAEYVKVPGANLFKKPEGLSYEAAAGIGITYTTAWNSLVLRAGIRQGDTVVVHAAGSGAGTALIQVAKLYNARIIATVGDDGKAAKAAALGVHRVVNHTKEDLVRAVKDFTAGELADIAVDHVGAETFTATLASLKRGGRLVTFGATSGNDVTISLRHVFGKNLSIHGVYVGPKAAFSHCLRLFPDRLSTVVDSVYDFTDAAAAYEKMLSRKFFGKIVVRVQGG